MLRLLPRFLVVALLIAATLYITISNAEPAVLRLGPSLQIAASAGVLYLGVFGAGLLVALTVALFFGLKGQLRERRLRAAEKQRQSFFELFLKARNQMAAAEWEAARATWEQVLRRDPTNSIALGELATCLDALGDPSEALRLLDQHRSEHRPPPDLLFKAAELNEKLGNSTAARDNLARLVSEAPSRKALTRARDLSAQLRRFDDALRYHGELERFTGKDTTHEQIKLELLLAQLVHAAPHQTALRETLREFTKRNPSCVAGLEQLAELEIAAGAVEEAAELLVRAAKATPEQPARWLKVVDLWIRKGPGDLAKRAERAIAAARSATRNLSGTTRVEAELVLAQTMLALNRNSDAESILEGVPTLAEREGVSISGDLQHRFTALRGASLARLGHIHDTVALWEELSGVDRVIAGVPGAHTLGPQQEPSPQLATP